MDKDIKNINIILDEVSKLYQLDMDKGGFSPIGNSANLIYEFQHKGEYFILRITEKDIEHLANYEAELDFINYLAENKVSVSKAITSVNSKLVEFVKDSNSCYIISVFEKAAGHMPVINDAEEWNDKLFYKWGQTMGQMHALSKGYKLNNKSINRKQWNEDIYFTNEYITEDESIADKWNKIINEISLLPKDEKSYGLIHYDFHQYNFFINKDDISVFDFDDCLYHWFICDIAIAFYHAVACVPVSEPKRRIDFARDFIEAFLKGYLKENLIEDYWIEKIPLFLEYRRICSYMFFAKMWDNQNIEPKQKEALERMRCNIVNEIPYIEIDFRILKEKLTCLK